MMIERAHAKHPYVFEFDARFLADFAPDGSFGLFAVFEKSARNSPTRAGTQNMIEQQDFSCGVCYDDSDGSRKFFLCGADDF